MVVIVLEDGPIVKACVDAGAVVYKAGHTARYWSAGAHIIRQLNKSYTFKFAIVNSALSRFVLGGLYANGIPCISLVHEVATTSLSRIDFTLILALSVTTVFPSGYVRNSVRRRCIEYFEDDHPIIPQGLCKLPPASPDQTQETAEEVRRKMGLEGLPADTVVLGAVGTVDYRKGADLFLNIATRILELERGKNIHFVWVGKGYRPEHDGAFSAYIADQLIHQRLDGYVTFAGEISNVAEAYNNIDALLLTSRMDPMPNVAIEAMCHGVPVVCFEETTGIADYLREIGLGDQCVAKYLDVDGFAERIVDLVSSPSKRVEISERCKVVSQEKFNMKDYCGQIEQIALTAAKRK